MVRGAVGMFLLLFFEVRFVGFGWMFLVWEAMRRRHTPPVPLEVTPKSWTGYTLSGNGKSPVLYRALSL